MSVKSIIESAYGIKDSQLTGPPWLDNERYTIEAKAETKTSEKELLVMLQALLTERFKLVFHREEKLVPGYALVVAKSGLKIHPSGGEGSSSRGTPNKYTAQHLGMPHFTGFLERMVGQPVIDETHLDGSYDFVLEYADERRPRGPEADRPTPPHSPQSSPHCPSSSG